MADENLEQLYREMNVVADSFPMGLSFWSACLDEFKQLLKGLFPDLPPEQVIAAFERWARQYEARDQEHERARMRQTVSDWRERDRLLTQMKFLPDGPERAAVEGKLWALACKVADLYAPHRPQPLAAKWAADSEAS